MRPFAKFLVFLLLAPCFLQAQQLDTIGVDRLLRQAKKYLESADLNQAEYYAEKSAAILEWCEDQYAPALLEARHLAGHAALEQGSFEKAAFHFKEASRIAANSSGKKSLLSAQAFNDEGLLAFAEGRLQEALVLHQNAFVIRFQILGEEHPKTADSHNNIANCYQILGQTEQALWHYRKVLVVRYRHNGPLDPAYASALNNIANTLLSLGRTTEAVQNFRTALAIRTQKLGFSHPKTAQSMQNLGNAYFEQGQIDSAQWMFEQALIRFQQLYEPSNPRLADIYENLGNSAVLLSDYRGALDNYQKAISIRQKSFEAGHPKIAQLYAAIGNVMLEKGEAPSALTYLRQARALLLSAGGEARLLAAGVMDQIGLACRQTEQWEEALQAHLQALEIRKEFYGSLHPTVAGAYANLGNYFWEQKNYQRAHFYYQNSLLLWRSLPGTTPGKLSAAWTNLGNCLLEEGQLSEARICFQQAQLPGLPIRQQSANLRQLGLWAQRAGHYDQAFSYFKEALQILGYVAGKPSADPAEVLPILSLQAVTWLQRHKVCQDPQDLKQALGAYRESIRILIFLLDETTDADSRRRLSFQYRMLFEGGLEAALLSWENEKSKLEYLAEAINWNEQSKSVGLAASTAAFATQGLPDVWRQAFEQLQQDKRRLDKTRNQLIQEYPSSHPLVEQADSSLFAWSKHRDSLENAAVARFPDFARRKVIGLRADLKSLREKLGQDQAMISFFAGDKQLFAFFIHRDTLAATRIELDSEFQKNIADLGQSILAYPFAEAARRAAIDEIYTLRSRLLYQQIWTPLATKFPLPSRLIIVPDGALGFLPFEALLYENPKKPGLYRSYPYLLQKHTFSYAYSAALLNFTLDQRSLFWARGYLGIAPDFAGDSRGLQPLFYNKEEIEKIMPYLGGKKLLGQKASMARFLRHAPDYRILHLATHGQADTKAGEYSYLAFTEIKDSLDNEKIEVKDLYGMRLPAELVVLSACESGVGAYQPGEGFISVARGFAYAGARSVLTTLWSVNDARTTEIMSGWYKRMRSGEARAKALRETKLHYIQNATQEAAHPFYWASYTIIGEVGPLPWSLQSWWHQYLVLALIILFVGILFWKRKQRTVFRKRG